MLKRLNIEYIFSALFVLIALVSIIVNTLTLNRLEKNYQKSIVSLEELFRTLYLTKQLGVLSQNINIHGTNYFLTGDKVEGDKWDDYLSAFYLSANDLKHAPSFAEGVGMAELHRLEVVQQEKAKDLIEQQTLSPEEKKEFFMSSVWRNRNEEIRLLLDRLIKNEQNHYVLARQSLMDYKDKVTRGNNLISLFLLVVSLSAVYAIYKFSKMLRLAHQKALDAITSRDEILAVVSHDLKNPLSTINLSTDVMLRRLPEHEEESTRKGLLRIKSAVGVMMELIRDLLDQAKLEAGKLELQIHDELFQDALSKTQELLTPLSQSKSIEIVSHLPQPPVVVRADKRRLVQILTNLLSNALKFSRKGGKVIVSATVKGEVLKVAVRDNGEGIGPTDLPHVFERYWQKEKDSQQGTGLGLAIVKELVRAQGGRIWVESKVGEGTTFFFTVPLAS